jgi:NAD(P)H-flavin reductase
MPATLVEPMLPQLYKVVQVRHEIPDTFTLELVPQHGGTIFPFTSGQFTMLSILGKGEIPISISGDPTKLEHLVHTVRAVGPVSQAMQAIQPDDVMGVRGPFGTGWPMDRAAGKDVVLLAGGIGLAPLRPSIYQILSDRKQYGRVFLLYGARTPADLLYEHELTQWRSRLDIEVMVTVDAAQKDWRGDVGVVTKLLPRANFDPSNTVAMVCGPEIMMRFCAYELINRGVPTDNIFVSMERNMKCGIAFCGHCQFGTEFVCRDGPVFSYTQVKDLLTIKEI